MHSAPRGSEPAGATMVGEGAGIQPGAVDDASADEVAGAEEAADEVARNPLQRPSERLHVLNAHCASDVHEDWKLPHTVCSIEFTA